MRPLDDHNMVSHKIIREAHETIECSVRSRKLFEDVQLFESALDEYLIDRIDDHLQWLIETHEGLSPKAIATISDCLYKFALVGLIIGKKTYSTELEDT